MTRIKIPNPDDLGEMLRKVRESAGFTREAVGELLGVDASYIQRIEYRDYKSLNLGFVSALAKIYGVPVSIFVEQPRRIPSYQERSARISRTIFSEEHQADIAQKIDNILGKYAGTDVFRDPNVCERRSPRDTTAPKVWRKDKR